MNEKNNIAPKNEEINVTKYETENIKNLIYTIRGKQVMIDSDVAMLYHYETKKINQTVKRNIERFPEKFCFQLNEDEVENLKSQFESSSLEKENELLRSQIVTLNKDTIQEDFDNYSLRSQIATFYYLHFFMYCSINNI